MRIIIRPVAAPHQEVDLTNRLVAAIAEELWRLYGGNEQLNWLEAELHLQHIVGAARDEAKDTSVVLAEEWAPSPELCRTLAGRRRPSDQVVVRAAARRQRPLRGRVGANKRGRLPVNGAAREPALMRE